MFGSEVRKARREAEIARLEALLTAIRAETERRRGPDYCLGCVRMERGRHPDISERAAIQRVRSRQVRVPSGSGAGVR